MQYFPLNSSQYLFILLYLIGFDKNSREQRVISFLCVSPENIDANQCSIAYAIEQGWNHVVKENEALRICFTKNYFTKKQYVTDFVYRKIERENFPGTYDELKEKVLNERHYIPWSNVPMWRVKSYLLSDGRVATHFAIDHLICDGYSTGLIYKQLSDAFEIYLSKDEPDLKMRPAFTQSLATHAAYRKSDDYKRDFAFWWKEFNTRKNFKIAAGRASLITTASTIEFEITGEQYEQVVSLTQELGISMPFFFQAIIALTTRRMTGYVDFALHTVTHGRRKLSEKQTIGCMMAALPVFFNFADKGGMSIREFMETGYVNFIDTMSHSRIPASDIIPISFKEAVHNGLNFIPGWLYFSAMDYADIASKTLLKYDQQTYYSMSNQLYLAYLHCSDKIQFELSYQNKKYTEDQINCILDEAKQVLSSVLKDSDQTIDDLCRN